MSKPWYRKVGFFDNPFSIKPSEYNEEVIAYDLDYITRKIDNGQMMFIEGAYGTGKTTILKSIINNFRGKNKIIYYNFNRAHKKFDVKKLLAGANSFIRNMIGMNPYNVILLIDEAGFMKVSDAKSILKHYRTGAIKSVIFVNHDYSAIRLPDEIEELLEGNVIRTIRLSKDEAVEFIRKRIGDSQFLSNMSIRKIFELSHYNPRKLLQNCEDVCRFAIEIGDNEVSDFHISEVLGSSRKEKKRKKQKVQKAENQVEERKTEQAKTIPSQRRTNRKIKEEIVQDSTITNIEKKAATVDQSDNEDLPEYNVVFFDRD
ncbi:ATP-binding protein [Candidatus Woesearchaeota archaeon]|nr:ATP-binding protein [Candidatus Woesearchaeota archaeon]